MKKIIIVLSLFALLIIGCGKFAKPFVEKAVPKDLRLYFELPENKLVALNLFCANSICWLSKEELSQKTGGDVVIAKSNYDKMEGICDLINTSTAKNIKQ